MNLLEKLVDKIVNLLIKYGVVNRDDTDVYKYCVESLIEKIVFFSIILSVGCLLKKILVTILFLIYFSFLRTYAGGFHMKTSLQCFCMSIISYFFCIEMIYLINKMDVKMQFGFTIAVSLLICIFAPVENVNNPLSENNRKVNKIRTIVVVLIGFIVAFVMQIYSVESAIVLAIVLATEILVLVSQVIGLVINQIMCYK